MTSNEIREKYLKFFEERGHVRINPSPLVLENDPTTLFTSSGMQQLVAYLKGEKTHPKGKRLVDSQPSLRLQDIEEVGDTSHTTFFEMLGNWSLGDYFKAEQLSWIWEFFTKELGLHKDKLWISVFEGTADVPKDIESIEIWKSLGVPEERIKAYGVKKNWWSISGTPEEMPAGEIGGPDSEVFYEFDSMNHRTEFGKSCHPNCQCGRFLEIGNSVFMQYKKNEDGTLSELPQKNVDFGGGLERIAAAVNNDPDVFKIDVYKSIIDKVKEATGKNYVGNERPMRIISDHTRAASALVEAGIIPSNKLHGYILRRLIRRATLQMKKLKGSVDEADFKVISGDSVILGEIKSFNEALKKITPTVDEYAKKFIEMYKLVENDKDLKALDTYYENLAKNMFFVYQSYGYPVELMLEDFKSRGIVLDQERFDKFYQATFLRHQKSSRASSASMFKAK